MSKRSDKLKEQRQAKIQAMQAILDGAADNGIARALTSEESTNFNTTKTEVEVLDGEITAAEQFEARALQMESENTNAAQHQRGSGSTIQVKKNAAPYSLGKALREFSRGGEDKLTGIEAEQHHELARGISSEGLLVPYNRAANTTTTHAGAIITNIDAGLSVLGSEPLYKEMGITIVPDLRGSFKIGKKAADVASKVAEEADITAESGTPSFVTMAAERFGVTDLFTKELLAQESPAVQAAIINDMIKGSDRKITAEVYTVALAAATATTGGALTEVGFNTLMAAVDGDGAFAMERGSFFTAKAVKVDAGSGINLVKPGIRNGIGVTHDGTPVFYSALFADGSLQQYVIYGVWAEIWLGLWGALEILFNPYTYQKSGQVEVTVNQLADVACRNASAFVKSPDLET